VTRPARLLVLRYLAICMRQASPGGGPAGSGVIPVDHLWWPVPGQLPRFAARPARRPGGCPARPAPCRTSGGREPCQTDLLAPRARGR